jgi:hypothetical protein
MRTVLTAVLTVILLATGCAFDLVHVKQLPAKLDTSQQPKSPFVLEREENLDLGTGYTRVLKEKTSWTYVGRIDQGDVFKTKDQVLTVEASNIHEAYIVLSSEKMVGFFLPVEGTFSPLSSPRMLKTSASAVNP